MEEMYDVNETQDTQDEDTKSEAITDAVSDDVTEAPESDEKVNEGETDYETLMASDVETLKAEFPELKGIKDITDLHNPLRYAALRDLGLSPEEAYMATAKRKTQDTRSHLTSAHGRSAATAIGMMSQHELATARELFPEMSDSEIQRLYKKVTK